VKTIKAPLKIDPLFILMALVLLAFAWRAVFIYRPIEWVTNFWLFEDFGYSLKIARNIALGLGETFDGVVFTSGYQPLYVWLMVPVFWIFPKNLEIPVYLAETLLAICNSVTVVFIYAIVARLTKRQWSGIAAAALWAFNLAIARNGSLGLETGLSTMMVAATMTYVVSLEIGEHATRKALALGALLGVTFLARVDAAFLVAVTLLYFLSGKRASRRETLAFLIVTLAVFALVVGPYCLWNQLHYGSPLPTSGQVTTGKSSLFSSPLSNQSQAELRNHVLCAFYIIGRMLVGITSVNGYDPFSTTWSRPVALITAVVLVATAVFSYRSFPASRRQILFVAGVGGLYTLGNILYGLMPYERYFLPPIFAFTILVTVAATGLLASLRFPARLRGSTIAVAMVLPLVCFGVTSKAKLLSEETRTYGWYDGIRVLNRIAQPGDTVGAFQTGNTGYFYDKGRAVNLDGVVNMNAYHARMNKTIDEYVTQNNIKFIADEDPFPLSLTRDMKTEQDRASFLARLSQVYANPAYLYTIYRIGSEPYKAIRKPEPAAGWAETPQPYATFRHALVSATPGARVAFSSDRPFDLRFLRQASSGMANVYRDGVLLDTVDLYAPVFDSTYKFPVSGDGQVHRYEVEVAQETNAGSTSHQVWFDAILER
jgi:4-amino-4-deoxy-L-arabinose transferase-like glycosyltransferase